MAAAEATARMDEEKEKSLEVRSEGLVGQIRNFWHDVKAEMKKVSWPSQAEVIHTTAITIITVIFFSLYLFLADLILTYVIKAIEWVANKIF